MRGERSLRAAASLAALATLLLLDSLKLGSAEVTSIDPQKPRFYGDPCTNNQDCSFPDAVCDELRKICQCHPNVPVSNYKDKCGKPVGINKACAFTEQCEDVNFKTECKNGWCACKFELLPEVKADGSFICTDPQRQGLYGDPCTKNQDCSFPNAVCDELVKTCKCHPDFPVSNYKDMCGKPASIDDTCMFTEQCEDVNFKTECKNGRCVCKYEMVPEVMADGSFKCSYPQMKGFYGDLCTKNQDCSFPDAICDELLKTCKCHSDVPITNYKDKCGKPASINETCMFNEQCEHENFKTECKNGRCVCKFEMVPEVMADGSFKCTSHAQRRGLYGDSCSITQDCLFLDAVCDDVHKICQCHPDVPISNYKDKCGRPASINETCMFNEQCEDVYFKTECKNDRCVCKFEMVPEVMVDGGVICTSVKAVEESTQTLDPAMIGVLVGMAVMFIIICVVLQLFSRARWRENRTIFNTPNPRLMNVSLLRDSKLLHSQDRRGSRVSVRPPSRQASQQDLRAHSPSPGSRRGSRASSGHSATSLRSATIRSPTTSGPTSVTVEIRKIDT